MSGPGKIDGAENGRPHRRYRGQDAERVRCADRRTVDGDGEDARDPWHERPRVVQGIGTAPRSRESRPMKFESLIRLLNGFHAARVLVLGDVMLDRFVYGSVDRISPEAPIPVVNVERFLDMPGGAANVARNIAAMGAHATLLGAVSHDAS